MKTRDTRHETGSEAGQATRVSPSPVSCLSPDPFAELTCDDRVALQEIAKLWCPAERMQLEPLKDPDEVMYQISSVHLGALQKLIRLCSAIKQL
jgi:hypothetical protein